MAKHIVLRDRDVLTEALNIPCESRTAEDLKPIIDFVKGLKIFASFSSLHPETLAKIASKLELHSYYASSHIFTEGDTGDHFYIVLDGEIAIVRRRSVAAAAALGQDDFVAETVVLVKLGTGKYFCENALESADGLRTASAVATKRTRLLSLHRDEYQSVLHNFKTVLKEHVLSFLKSSTSIFKELPSSSIDYLASFASIRTFSVNEPIFQAGTKCRTMMLIRTGIVKLIKAIPNSEMRKLVYKADYKIRHSSLDGTGNVTGWKAKTKEKKMTIHSSGRNAPNPTSPKSPLSPVSALTYSPVDKDNTFKLPTIESNQGSRNNSPRARLGSTVPFSPKQTITDHFSDSDEDKLLPGSWLLQGKRDNDDISENASENVRRRQVSTSDELVMMAHAAVASAASMGSFSQPVTSDPQVVQSIASRSVEHDKEQEEIKQRHLRLQGNPSIASLDIDDGRAFSPGSTKSRKKGMRSRKTNNNDLFSDSAGVPVLVRRPIDLNLTASSSQSTNRRSSTASLISNSSSTAAKSSLQSRSYPLGSSATGDKVDFTVAVLLAGQVIGELALLDPEQATPVGAVAATSVELYCFDKQMLQRAGIDNCNKLMESLKDDWKFRNPPIEEICKRAKMKYEWEAQKNQIMKYYFGKR